MVTPPIFEGDDFDWALGTLMDLIWQGKRAGTMAHSLDPELFHACMTVINAQPFPLRQFAHEMILRSEPQLFVSRRHVYAHPY